MSIIATVAPLPGIERRLLQWVVTGAERRHPRLVDASCGPLAERLSPHDVAGETEP